MHSVVVCCTMQGLVATIERTMRESREYVKAMDRYKTQLYSIWAREDVQTWVTAFNELLDQTQAAHNTALDAARSKDQVCSLGHCRRPLFRPFVLCPASPDLI